MKRAIITVGLSFGDEGKGATIDYLARTHDAGLVVRYCGGSQAGHNVQLPDGSRHTFSQFGAGTLAPSKPLTYLGPATIIDPPALLAEGEHLLALGAAGVYARAVVHPSALVATAYHRLLNRLRELARGAGRHGSCGRGIGEARSYRLRYGADAVVAADLRDFETLADKMDLLRQRALLEMQDLLPRVLPADVPGDLFRSSARSEARDLMASFHDDIALSAALPGAETTLFEGAQGVLLDEYRGFHPHTTWSTTTPLHAWELIDGGGFDEVTVLGLTRTYATRHGAGPMPTYSPEMSAAMADPGNPFNDWQGDMRRGVLDLPLLRYAAACAGRLDGLAVSHLDEVDSGLVCVGYEEGELAVSRVPDLAHQERLTARVTTATPVLREMTREDLLAALAEVAPPAVLGAGPTWRDRTTLSLRSRRRAAVAV